MWPDLNIGMPTVTVNNMVKIINGYRLNHTTLGIAPKRYFDPRKVEDLLEYKHFKTILLLLLISIFIIFK